ncbi:MAG: hypothetical protein ACTHJ5_04870 [Ilyomonas sp.]
MKKIRFVINVFIGFFMLMQLACTSGSDKSTGTDTAHTTSPVDSMPVVQPEVTDSSHVVTPPSTHDSNVVVPKP